MAYTKNTWQTGDTITADLMNHMEDGIYANAEAVASQSGAIENVKTALATKENVANKVTEITDESTDEQYPSAKAVHDAIEEAGGGSYEFTTYHMVFELLDGQPGTVHTDIPGVNSWQTFENVVADLIEDMAPCQIHVKAHGVLTGEDKYAQFIGFPWFSNTRQIIIGTSEEYPCFVYGSDGDGGFLYNVDFGNGARMSAKNFVFI